MLEAAAPGSLDLAALAEVGDDEQLAALLEGMLRGGDELFLRVFERVDGAVTEALMASAAEGAEGAEVAVAGDGVAGDEKQREGVCAERGKKKLDV